ncbi:MAG: DNA-binding protein [Candidatus Methanoperedenaceae archaeon]|nr:DNA-binding protein [Candidatus Methanoperedenaceae archaeon]
MEKILDREVAWRVFAWEFNRSNMHISEGDERAPNYIITPTGVKCNRLFIVGVVTEVENIGKDNTLWRGRVADPTGVFTVYAGQYQPESAIFLSELNIPAYVAVVGKARKFEPEDGSVYTSVRPEEINNADEKLRDRWVLDTAERTLERIMYIEDALSSGKSGNDLKNYLLGKGINAVLADGATKAVEHYKNLDKTIAELKNVVIHAIKTVAPVDVVHTYGSAMDEIKTSSEIEEAVVEEEKEMTELKEPETGPKEIIAGIIDKLDTGKGIQYSTVVEAAQKKGIDPETVESGIKELMDEGRCYEPKIGVLRKV